MDGFPTNRSNGLVTTGARDGTAANAVPTPGITALRLFLAEPGVENEFYAMKALVQRAETAGQERLSSAVAAAAAEIEAGRLARAHDEDLRLRFGFAIGTGLALGLAAVDAIPAFLAAQAFGLDQLTTLGITAVLVAALAAAMWAATHYQSGWQRWLVIGALAAGLTAIGALRWWYLLVTAGDESSAVLEAIGLTIFTALLVWLGVVVLGFTKTRQVSAAERRSLTLRRRAERATGKEVLLASRAGVAMREFMGRAQVFSSRSLDDDESRNRFLEHVRSEVEW